MTREPCSRRRDGGARMIAIARRNNRGAHGVSCMTR
jgi:hypothetical protein